MLKGIDISTYQGQVDWAAVKAAGLVSFVYCKATEGVSELDDQFKRNRDVAQNRGIPVGAYHFFHPGEDPIAQADHFLDVAAKPFSKLIPMVDVEVADDCSADQIVAQLAKFTAKVERYTAKRMLIYTGYAFWNEQVNGSDAFSGHPLWVAAYADSYDDSLAAPVPNGWQSATIWQYSASGQIPGITGNADLDRLEVPLSDITLQ